MTRLEIFHSNDIKGPYQLVQTIQRKEPVERGAGPIFTNNQKLIRPSQDCKHGYGKGVIFNALSHDGCFSEEISHKISSNVRFNNGLCLHTFSRSGDIAVIDGLDYPIRFLGRLAPNLYGLKSSLMNLLKSKQ